MVCRCGHCHRSFRSRQAVAAHLRTCRAAVLEIELVTIKRDMLRDVAAEAKRQVVGMLTLIHFEPPAGVEPH